MRWGTFDAYHRALTRPTRRRLETWRNIPPLAKEGAVILACVVVASAITGGLVGALLRL